MSPLIVSLAFAQVTATTHQYNPTESVAPDPAMATVVVRSNYWSGIELFRKIEEPDRVTWNGIRQDTFAKASKKYDRALRTYETDIKMWNSGKSFDRQLLGYKPIKPTEVSLDSTPMMPIELNNYVGVGRKPSVAEDSAGMRTYIVKIPPGTYYIAGAPNPMSAIGVGTCFCMGTVGFTVRAGQMVDAGTITGSPTNYFAPATYTRPVAGEAALPQFGGRAVEPAVMFASGKLANFQSLPVTRIKAVPGLLGYNRDIPLDSASQPVPAVR